jgi:hypothetical protein
VSRGAGDSTNWHDSCVDRDTGDRPGIERFSICAWRDDTVVEHYTNDVFDVAELYRDRIAKLIKD